MSSTAENPSAGRTGSCPYTLASPGMSPRKSRTAGPFSFKSTPPVLIGQIRACRGFRRFRPPFIRTLVRIHEILFLNKDATEGDRPYSQLDRRPLEFHGDLTNLATSFTRRGLVKHLWNPKRSEEQPFGPAPPDSETELMPSGGTLGPGTASS